MESAHSPIEKPPARTGWVKPRAAEIICLAALVLLAADVRFWSALGDLWYDELNVISFVDLLIRHPLDILYKAPFDNNHLLMTWWVYLSGPNQNAFWYRLPSIIAGSGSVAIAWLIGRRINRVACWTCATAIALSYPLINYDSEARGYAMSVFFLLLAYWLITGPFIARRRLIAPLFWLACVAGVLANLLFAVYFALAAAWALWLAWRKRWPWRPALFSLTAWFAPPGLFLVWLYFAFVRHVQPLHGGPVKLSHTLLAVASLLVGGPLAGWLMTACAAAGLLLLALSLFAASRRNPDVALLLALLILAAPIPLIAINPIGSFYPRYFLLSLTPALLLLAAAAARLLINPGRPRCLAIALLIAFIIFNAVGIHRLLTLGRGHYTQTCQNILDHTNTPLAVISSDDDHATELEFADCRSRLTGPAQISYTENASLPPAGTEWRIIATSDSTGRAPAAIHDRYGNEYLLFTDANFAGLSGLRWKVYRNKSSPPVHPSQ